jgi:2-oxoglutarate/2-oxoacid ferredoxin oxidoreductase subunit beta
MSSILNTPVLPYCKGCGHGLIAKNTARALENMGMPALEVIIVTDIGCHGIIDRCLSTHTVHGLHGRSVALGAGIAFGLDNSGKKIIVFIGDGGSTIGLQHILEAARLNVNMTVVVHNNMLYGMTGGQTSGLTPRGFRTNTSLDGNPYSGYDVCALSHTAGAAYVSRVTGTGDFSACLQKAFEIDGFSLVEVVEICPGYGVKLNPGKKLSEIMENAGRPPGKWRKSREAFGLVRAAEAADLLAELKVIEPDFRCSLYGPLSVVISGSAGEGVQLAASLLSTAAVRSGCHVTRKGSYPVTVGVGFSTAELIVSPEPIGYHGIEVPDAVVITSADGLAHNSKRIAAMVKGKLFIDASLDSPQTGAEVHSHDFRSLGSRSASLFALFMFAAETGYVSRDALHRTVIDSGLQKKIPLARIMERI